MLLNGQKRHSAYPEAGWTWFSRRMIVFVSRWNLLRSALGSPSCAAASTDGVWSATPESVSCPSASESRTRPKQNRNHTLQLSSLSSIIIKLLGCDVSTCAKEPIGSKSPLGPPWPRYMRLLDSLLKFSTLLLNTSVVDEWGELPIVEPFRCVLVREGKRI